MNKMSTNNKTILIIGGSKNIKTKNCVDNQRFFLVQKFPILLKVIKSSLEIRQPVGSNFFTIFTASAIDRTSPQLAAKSIRSFGVIPSYSSLY